MLLVRRRSSFPAAGAPEWSPRSRTHAGKQAPKGTRSLPSSSCLPRVLVVRFLTTRASSEAHELRWPKKPRSRHRNSRHEHPFQNNENLLRETAKNLKSFTRCVGSLLVDPPPTLFENLDGYVNQHKCCYYYSYSYYSCGGNILQPTAQKGSTYTSRSTEIGTRIHGNPWLDST